MGRAPDPELAERRRRQILEAALVCFARRGFHQATMSEICREAQLSAGALYRYFASKTDIIVAIAEEHRRQATEALVRIDPAAPLIDTMVSLIELELERVLSLGGALLGDVIAEASRDPELASRLKESDLGVRRGLVCGIEAAQARGDLDAKLDAEAAARIIEAFLDGVVIRLAIIPDTDMDQARRDIRLFLERLLQPRPRPAAKAPTRARLEENA